MRTRRSVAQHAHDQQARAAAKRVLKYPPVRFDGVQAKAIATGFGTYATRGSVSILACAILPEHVHLVIARHRLPIESLLVQFKGSATRVVISRAIHPLGRFVDSGSRPPKMWARGHWSVYLDRLDAIHRAVSYVEDNPVREGKRPQRWSFVDRDALPSRWSGRG